MTSAGQSCCSWSFTEQCSSAVVSTPHLSVEAVLFLIEFVGAVLNFSDLTPDSPKEKNRGKIIPGVFRCCGRLSFRDTNKPVCIKSV